MVNAIPGISCVKPEGAFYAFPKLEMKQPDAHFVGELIKETGVVIVPAAASDRFLAQNILELSFYLTSKFLKKLIKLLESFLLNTRKNLLIWLKS